MLRRLKLRNYKCWFNADIEFDRVTTFIGRNSRGKSSSTFYPLKAILTNGDLPERLISHGQKELEIRVEFDNKTWIKRTRNDMGQTLSSSEGKTYSGKKGLDDVIKRISGVSKVDIDESGKAENLNFISADASMFLIDKSAEVIRRRLSGILQLNELESARSKLSIRLKDIEQKKYDTAAEIDHCKLLLGITEKKLNLLDKIESKSRVLTLLEDYQKLEPVELPSLDGLKTELLKMEYLLCSEIQIPEIPVHWNLLLDYFALEPAESTASLDEDIQNIETELKSTKLCPTCQQPI